MTQEEKDYLYWRCKVNWHNKYHRYINEWINNVIPTQLEYFKKEMEILIKLRVYDAGRKENNSLKDNSRVSEN